MAYLRSARDWQQAEQEADRLITWHGCGAWDKSVQRAWEAGGRWQSDYWWHVTRIIERRLGKSLLVDRTGERETKK
jgi:hypothetical protein